MVAVGRYLAQSVLYALFFLPLVYLTHSPSLRHLPEETAVIKVAVRHAGKIIGECTAISSEDYENLAANMKRPEICPRERSPLQLELTLDGETLYRDTISASGLHNDGVSSMYRRFVVPSGKHRLQLMMNDDVAKKGNTWEFDQIIELEPAQVMVASFKGGFKLQ